MESLPSLLSTASPPHVKNKDSSNFCKKLAHRQKALRAIGDELWCSSCHLQDENCLIVHHIDHNRKNNKLENLAIIPIMPSDIKTRRSKQRVSLSQSYIGQQPTEGAIRIAHVGKWSKTIKATYRFKEIYIDVFKTRLVAWSRELSCLPSKTEVLLAKANLQYKLFDFAKTNNLKIIGGFNDDELEEVFVDCVIKNFPELSADIAQKHAALGCRDCKFAEFLSNNQG
jgi:hypothetical protein